MPHRKKSEEIRSEDGNVILSISGHVAHEVGTEDLKIEIFREDTAGWVLAHVYMTSDREFRISAPFRDKANVFRPYEFGRYEFVDDSQNGVRLESRSSGCLKMLSFEYEEYSKKFFGRK